MRLIIITALAIGATTSGVRSSQRRRSTQAAARQPRRTRPPKTKDADSAMVVEVLSQRDADRRDAHDERRALRGDKNAETRRGGRRHSAYTGPDTAHGTYR